MAGRLELPFLYQTKTILRVAARRLCPGLRFASSQTSHEGSTGKAAPFSPREPVPTSKDIFLSNVEEPNNLDLSPLASQTLVKGSVNTTINSAVTASEKRAFNAILRFAPEAPKPTENQPRHSRTDAAETDIDSILSIFTSALQDSEAGPATRQRNTGSGTRKAGVDRFEPKTSPQQKRIPQGRSAAIPELQSSSEDPRHGRQLRSALTHETASGDGSSLPPLGQIKPIAPLQTRPLVAVAEPLDAAGVSIQATTSVDQSSHKGSPKTLLSPTSNLSSSNELRDSTEAALRDRMQAISQALLDAAKSTTLKGDIAMWQVVESQIFSIGQRFSSSPVLPTYVNGTKPYGGITKFTFSREKSDKPREMIEAAQQHQQQLQLQRQRQRQRQKDRISAQAAASKSTSLSDPAHQPSSPGSAEPLVLSSLQKIYPAALLLALRLYITHHPTSPYPFLLLPRIRALGTTSYVLGASAPFYNSLISLVWDVRSSLRDVDSLLDEMERGGVEMDEGTYTVLGAIEHERASNLDELADAGSGHVEEERYEEGAENNGKATWGTTRGARWWHRQEQMLFFPKILDWLDIISGRLAAKERPAV